MAKFIKAPNLEATQGSGQSAVETFLLNFGIETGHVGAVLLGLAAVCLLMVLIQLYRVIRGGLGKYAQGKVVDVQPAPGGGLNPVVRYTDAEGRGRQFIGQFRVGEQDIGRLMRLRVDGDRPTVAPPPPNPARQAAFLVLPLVVGAACMTAAIMGEIPGVVTLPGL